MSYASRDGISLTRKKKLLYFSNLPLRKCKHVFLKYGNYLLTKEKLLSTFKNISSSEIGFVSIFKISI